jgi:hypothetical protein
MALRGPRVVSYGRHFSDVGTMRGIWLLLMAGMVHACAISWPGDHAWR